jgi:hypothetical protein
LINTIFANTPATLTVELLAASFEEITQRATWKIDPTAQIDHSTWEVGYSSSGTEDKLVWIGEWNGVFRSPSD